MRPDSRCWLPLLRRHRAPAAGHRPFPLGEEGDERASFVVGGRPVRAAASQRPFASPASPDDPPSNRLPPQTTRHLGMSSGSPYGIDAYWPSSSRSASASRLASPLHVSRRATTPEVASFPLIMCTEGFPGCAPRTTVCGEDEGAAGGGDC